MGGGSGQAIKASKEAKATSGEITEQEYNAAGFDTNSDLADFGERAINAYTGQDYSDLNGILGGYYSNFWGQEPTGKQIEQAKLKEKVLNKALDKLPSEVDVRSFRGLQDKALKEQLIANQGGEIRMKGFQSTSLDKETAYKFGGTDKESSIIIRIWGQNGKSIKKFSQFGDDEQEILFKSNSKFKITKYNKEMDMFFLKEI